MSEWLDKLIRSEGVEITGKDGGGWIVREDGVEISRVFETEREARNWGWPACAILPPALMIEPLHVATVGGRPLRFFRSPLGDGRPDFPWHAVDDLHTCMGLNQA